MRRRAGSATCAAAQIPMGSAFQLIMTMILASFARFFAHVAIRALACSVKARTVFARLLLTCGATVRRAWRHEGNVKTVCGIRYLHLWKCMVCLRSVRIYV